MGHTITVKDIRSKGSSRLVQVEGDSVSQLIHEALYFLPRGEHRHALEQALAERDAYQRTLEGIASCSTACPCCAMHARVARERLTKGASP